MAVNTKTARIAGLLYLTIIFAGIFAQFIVRESMLIAGDPTATANNILADEGLFRLGIVGDLIMILADVSIAVLFYVLLKPVNKHLALLSAFLRLAQATTLGINLLNLMFILQLLSGASYLDAFDTAERDALVQVFFEAHGIGYSLALLFFGLSILIQGYLLFKSGYFPKVLGVAITIAAIGYLVDTFAKVGMTNYDDYKDIFDAAVFGPAVLAEFALTLWLLIKGVKREAVPNRSISTHSLDTANA